MTSPAPPVTTGSFKNVMWPADVARIVNLLLTGSPLAQSFTRYPTTRSSVAFPTASPDRPAWTTEGAPLPVIGLGDDADIVAVAKLGEVVLLSNESVADTSLNLTNQVGELLRDSAGPELDRGLAYGSGPPEPRGIVAVAPAVTGEDLGAALAAGVGAIGDSGGAASHVAAKPSVLALARNTRDSTGQFVYPAGVGAAFGLTEVPAPELAAGDILLYDATRAYLVERDDFEIAVSTDYAFGSDSLAVRVRGRFAAAIPAIGKTLRRLEIEPASRSAARTKAA